MIRRWLATRLARFSWLVEDAALALDRDAAATESKWQYDRHGGTACEL